MTTASSAGQLPAVLVMSLDDPGYLNEIYKPLLSSLAQRSRLTHIRDAEDAVIHLNNNKPAAILITDPGIADSSFSEVLSKIKEYISGGGAVIFACMFSSFIAPDDFDAFFKIHFHLPWTFGDYHRTTSYLNANAKRILKSAESLPKSYNQKAVFMKNVHADHALYAPTQASDVESFVFSGRVNPAQTPVAWANTAGGWVGYVGDVNGEEASNKVILSMCGV